MTVSGLARKVGSRAGTPVAARGRAEYRVWLAYSIALGALIRLLPAVRDGFPVGDGGMFFVMARELRAHHYLLPAFTSYNGQHIPFAYPPLGFYLVNVVQTAFGISEPDAFRFVPAVVCVLTIAAFAVPARALLQGRRAVLIAVAAFSLLPYAFYWQIKGGGVTRSFGELFSILAIACTVRVFKDLDDRFLLPAAVCLGLTALSHPEWSVFAAYSVLVLFASYGRSQRGLLRLVVLSLGALLISAPWWLTVLHLHGLSPFLSLVPGNGPQDSPWYTGLLTLLSLDYTNEVGFPVFGALGMVGVWVCVAQRKWFLPCWFAVFVLVDGRGAFQRGIIFMSLFAGIAVQDLFLPALSSVGERVRVSTSQGMLPHINRMAAGVVIFLLLRALILDAGESMAMGFLTPPERTAMTWIQAHTPASSRFAVVDGSNLWATNNEAEWFPALTGRTSVTTVQGTEWLPGAFARRKHLNDRLQRCASQTSSCLWNWLQASHEGVQYIYVSTYLVENDKGQGSHCCSVLMDSLTHDRRFGRVYNGPGGAIYVQKSLKPTAQLSTPD